MTDVDREQIDKEAQSIIQRCRDSLNNVKKTGLLLLLGNINIAPPSSVAYVTADPGVACLNPSRATYLVPCVEIYHEIISMVILSIPLVQEGQLSATGESRCISTG